MIILRNNIFIISVNNYKKKKWLLNTKYLSTYYNNTTIPTYLL